MKQYTNKGLYNGYDKNHKEREALDYYATPTAEVTNILNIMQLPLNHCSILEPCAGGGHMVQGIINYLQEHNIENAPIYATDIKERGFKVSAPISHYQAGPDQDFFLDTYGQDLPTPYGIPHPQIDYIIMNPPYGVIEPFVIRALEIPKKGVLMLGRLQFLEGEKRYEKIFKDNPPTTIYVYVDRIACYINGDFSQKQASAQAYAWFYWNLENPTETTQVKWIRRADKGEK